MNGRLTVLRYATATVVSDLYRYTWVDVTYDIRSKFSESSAEMVLNFRAPFSSFAYAGRLAIYLPMKSYYGSRDNSSESYDFESLSFPMLDDMRGLDEMRGLDIKIFLFPGEGLTAIWTNSSAQKLQMSSHLKLFSYAPEPPFPFSRIAAINSKESPAMIYHQLTESVLVEEIWENTNRIWLKDNITI